jgi:proline dehydrogenase
VRPFAAPYVAGESVETALKVVAELNKQGFVATLDILGEHVRTPEESYIIRDAYQDLFRQINEAGLNSNVSLKPTHLGMEIDRALASENLQSILSVAQETNNFMRIDMENSPYTDTTIAVYRECYNNYSGTGTVLQSYLKRTAGDIQSLAPEIAFKEKEEIRLHFIEDVKALVRSGSYVGIATHDIIIIDRLEAWLLSENIPKELYEFQVLHGVPMGDRLQRLLASNHKVRVYVPFGEAWFDYATRRLKENPNMLWYIVGNIFKS